MAAKKSYNRFFIIFQEEDKGYGTGPDRPPTGYVKVETKSDKSKVTVYVQNLKPFENGECLYKCYLISHQDDKSHVAYLGIMDIDELGRGESSWESGAENAFDSKISIEKYNAAAIVVDREGMNAVVAPLAGYMSKEKFEWRNKLPVSKYKAEEKAYEEKVAAEEPVEEAVKFEEYEKQISEMINTGEKAEEPASAETQKEAAGRSEEGENTEQIAEVTQAEQRIESNETTEQLREEVEAAVEPEQVEVEKKAEVPVDSRVEEPVISEDRADENIDEEKVSPMEGKEEEIRGKHKDDKECCKHKKVESKCKKYDKKYEYEDYNNFYSGCMGYSKHDCRKMMCKVLEDILEDCEEAYVHKDLKDCKMWKIDMDKYKKDADKIYMYPCYDLIYYPMLNIPYCNYYNYIRKSGHYLFGIKYDNSRQARRALRRIVFGIPGGNTPLDQPFQGLTGFTTWIPSEDRNVKGYWIMMYDPMTGLISEP